MMRSALMMQRRPLSRFHRGFATTLFSDVVARSISAITTIVLIRFLAVGDYAFLVVFLAVGQFVGSAATGGLRMLYVRTEAERVARGTATEMPFGAVLAGGVAIIVIMALAGLLIAEMAGVGTPGERLYFVGLCAAFSIGQATVDLVSYHHQASLGFVKGGVVNVGRNVCLLAAAVVVGAVLGGSGPATAAALTAASLAAGAVASAKVFFASPAQRRIRGTRLGFTRESGWLTMYSLVAAGFATVDVFIVAVILSQKDVASFGAAQRYYAVALGAVPALEAVMRVRTAQPDIVESSTAQTSTLTVWVKRSALPLALLVGILALAARPVIPLIDHGRYPQSIPVFQVLLVGVFAYYLTLPAVNLLMAQRRFALLATAFGAAFAANAVGDFVLGPRLGIVAIAAVATTVLVLLSATVAICAYRPGGSRRVRSSFTSPRGALHIAIISGACAIVGLAVASVPQPVLLLVAALVVCTLLAVVIKWGELGIAMFLVAVTPLIPVVSGVYAQPKSYAGIDSSTLRTAGVAVLSVLALALADRNGDRGDARLPAVRPLLLALGGLGLASALFTAVSPSDFIKQAAQTAGQPLFYAIAITMFVDVLDRFPDAREKLVGAWCLALIGEGLIVAAQVATGAAYDPVRGITRAQGTIGADSLGAFAMFGVFGALYMRSVASTRLGRSLGTVALVASLEMMFLSISRGPVIAFAIALGLLLLPTGGRWTRKQLATALLLFSMAGLGIYLTKGLWLARLSAPTTAGFDRPATWVAGLRIASGHPLFGVGVAHIVTLVQSSSQYAFTQFGSNGAVPHDSWLFAAAADGLLYAAVLVLATVAFISAVYRAKDPSARLLRVGLVGVLLLSLETNLFNHPEVMLVVLMAAVLSTYRACGVAEAPVLLTESFALGHRRRATSFARREVRGAPI